MSVKKPSKEEIYESLNYERSRYGLSQCARINSDKAVKSLVAQLKAIEAIELERKCSFKLGSEGWGLDREGAEKERAEIDRKRSEAFFKTPKGIEVARKNALDPNYIDYSK